MTTAQAMLIPLLFGISVVMITCSHPAFSSDIDQAEEQLTEQLQGEATVSRRPIPKFTPEDIEKIKQAQEQLKELK